MGIDQSDSKWQELLDVREEFERDAVVLPTLRSRIDGKPRQPSARCVHLAEALAVSPSWSRISAARERRLAA